MYCRRVGRLSADVFCVGPILSPTNRPVWTVHYAVVDVILLKSGLDRFWTQRKVKYDYKTELLPGTAETDLGIWMRQNFEAEPVLRLRCGPSGSTWQRSTVLLSRPFLGLEIETETWTKWTRVVECTRVSRPWSPDHKTVCNTENDYHHIC